MFIIDDIISWIIGKILDRIFPGRDRNKKLLEILKNKDNEIALLNKDKEKLSTNLNEVKEKSELEKNKIFLSLKRRGISVKKLISKYDKPLVAIILSYATQKEISSKGYTKGTKFIMEELKRYRARYLEEPTY